MNQKIFNKIVKLNNDFYSTIESDFDKTRLSQWNGWNRVGEIIFENLKDQKSISILDVACGNGRFIKTLSHVEEGLLLFKYLGIDSNEFLLSKAKDLKNEHIQFMKLDVINDLEKLSFETFDVVVAFGITHHIPSYGFRKKWFSQLANLVSKNGLLIFTIWNYKNDSRFQNVECKKINSDELERGDYFIGWNNKVDVCRYYHQYDAQELKAIDDKLKDLGLELIETFKSDGKSNDLNKYRIYRRQ